MKKLIAYLTIIAFILCGCTRPETDGSATANTDESVSDTTIKDSSEMFTDRDTESTVNADGAAQITLLESGIISSSDAVKTSGSKATITDDGVYIISGSISDGMIVVDVPKTAKPQLVFKGVSITSKTSAPIYILNGDKVFITLEDGTENTLANGGSFVAIDENNIDSVIFSKSDLTINGAGTLNVTSPAGHGIVSKDDLVITGGVYNITTASHGIDANDSVRLSGATLDITAGKDGIHSENSEDTTLGFIYVKDGSYKISAEGDGMSAGAYMQIEDGSFDIITGGGSENASKQTSDNWGGFQGGGGEMGRPGDRGPDGMGGMMRPTSSATTAVTDEASTSIKGLKAATDMQITGGSFKIDSADDAIHSNGNITVTGGSFEIATGDDGFHADQKLSVTNGNINVTESYEGLEALDIDLSGGDIKLVASDDGLNAAGGNDQSGFGGMRGNEQFGGRGGMGGGPGGMGGMSSASDGSIVISGGTLYVNASGDGIDANGTLEISGGFTTVCGPTQGDTATLDYDVSAVISGGTFIGSGASGMAQTFSDAKQGLLSLSVGNQAAGTKVTVTDKSGKTIIETTPELSFAVIILSSPDVVSGETYTVNIGTDSGEFTAK